MTLGQLKQARSRLDDMACVEYRVNGRSDRHERLRNAGVRISARIIDAICSKGK